MKLQFVFVPKVEPHRQQSNLQVSPSRSFPCSALDLFQHVALFRSFSGCTVDLYKCVKLHVNVMEDCKVTGSQM